MNKASARLRPTACTRNFTSPWPGSREGRSSSFRFSGPPIFWKRTIFAIPGLIDFAGEVTRVGGEAASFIDGHLRIRAQGTSHVDLSVADMRGDNLGRRFA